MESAIVPPRSCGSPGLAEIRNGPGPLSESTLGEERRSKRLSMKRGPMGVGKLGGKKSSHKGGAWGEEKQGWESRRGKQGRTYPTGGENPDLVE